MAALRVGSSARAELPFESWSLACNSRDAGLARRAKRASTSRREPLGASRQAAERGAAKKQPPFSGASSRVGLLLVSKSPAHISCG